jgi:outer membrane protein
MKKRSSSAFLTSALLTSVFLTSIFVAGSAFAADSALIGVVNFASCVTDSKSGKQEEENMQNMRKQIAAMAENTEKELKELTAKLDDTEFVDSLSPKAEEEMRLKVHTLQEDMGRYQNQFYQFLQQAQYQMYQKMSGNIAKASEAVAKEKKLDYVINKEACFYIRTDLDVTRDVIAAMDKDFDAAPKSKDLSQDGLDLNNLDESFLDESAG